MTEQISVASAPKRQVSILAKIGYGSGHGLVSVKNMLFHFFFLFYFSNVMGVSELLVLLATLIALLIDAVSDPVMGQISDNFRSKRWGRRHGFMMLGILPTVIGLVFLFSAPADMGQWGLFVWMMVFTVIIRLGLTVYAVPYYSLGAELSTNYNERTHIVSFREFFNTAFNIGIVLVGLVVFLPDSEAFPKGMMNAAGYKPFAITMAVIASITAFIAIVSTRKSIGAIQSYQDDPRTRWTDTFTQLVIALKIKPFAWLCAGYSLLIIMYGAGSALSFYMGDYLWEISDTGKALVTVAPLITLIPAVLLASGLSSWIDKKPAALVLGVIYVICSIIPYALYLMGLMPPMGSGALLLTICAFSGVAFMGLTGMIVVSYSMMADVADLMELETTKRQEGVLSAAFTFAQKMTFAIGTAVASITLIVIKFPKQTAVEDVPISAVHGLAIGAIVTAVIFGLLGLYCFTKYPLTRAKHAAIRAQISEAIV